MCRDLSKLCSCLQKQVSEIKTTKSFEKVVSSTSTPSMLHSTHASHNGNSHCDDHVQKPSVISRRTKCTGETVLARKWK